MILMTVIVSTVSANTDRTVVHKHDISEVGRHYEWIICPTPKTGKPGDSETERGKKKEPCIYQGENEFDKSNQKRIS